MRKKFALYIFVILYLFCINVNTVHAEDCVSLKTQIDNYDAYTELLSTLDCTNDGDLSNVATCNEINVKKNVVVTKILKAQDEKKVCSNEQSRVDQIIEDNKNKCSKIFDDSFTNFVNGVMVVFYILGPILLLLFGSLDFAKATASAEEDALKKASTKFVKRLVATFLLYATPTIINLILSFNMTDKYLSGNAYSCDYKYLVYNKKYILKYTPTSNGSGSKRGNYTGGDYSNFVSYSQGDPEWSGIIPCATCSSTIGRAGCYITAFADIVASWRDASVTPKTLSDKYFSNLNPSTSAAFVNQIVPDYNLNYERINDISTSEGREKLYEVLGNGKSVLIYVSSEGADGDGVNKRPGYPLFAKNGRHNMGERITSRMHWIVLVGFDSDQTIAFANPNGGGIDYVSYETLKTNAEDWVGHVAWVDK